MTTYSIQRYGYILHLAPHVEPWGGRRELVEYGGKSYTLCTINADRSGDWRIALRYDGYIVPVDYWGCDPYSYGGPDRHPVLFRAGTGWPEGDASTAGTFAWWLDEIARTWSGSLIVCPDDAVACTLCKTPTLLTAGTACIECLRQLTYVCENYNCSATSLHREGHRSFYELERVRGEAVAHAHVEALFSQLFGRANTVLSYVEDGAACSQHKYECESCDLVWTASETARTCCWPSCWECGERYEMEDDAISCCSSYGNDDDDGLVHNYSYEPKLWFYADGEVEPDPRPDTLYLGVELEIERARPHLDVWYESCGEVYGDETFAWLKSDGSLSQQGVELVTAPATLDSFRSQFPWAALKALQDAGARSYAYGSCGMHIHVSRSAFTNTHLWRFVTFHVRNQKQVSEIGQRVDSEYASWDRERPVGKELVDLVTGKKKNDLRYLAINFQNDHTIELRYLKGNILPGAILRKLEMIDAIYHHTRSLDVNSLRFGSLTWDSFVSYVNERAGRYPELHNYLNNNHNSNEEE